MNIYAHNLLGAESREEKTESLGIYAKNAFKLFLVVDYSLNKGDYVREIE
jgi:hypothetical protein